jgi:hypothetical protein
MEKHINFSKKEDSPRKFWSRMVILKNRIVESGSFDQELLNKIVNVKRESFQAETGNPFIKPSNLDFSRCQK